PSLCRSSFMQGTSTLTIQNGAQVHSLGGSDIAAGLNSLAVATVSGANSQWTMTDPITVGDVGRGTLNVLNVPRPTSPTVMGSVIVHCELAPLTVATASEFKPAAMSLPPSE